MTERSDVYRYWQLESEQKALEVVKKLFCDSEDFKPDAERKTHRYIYTDETYLSEYEELRPLSQAYKGERTHEDYLRAFEHLDIYILDGDVHSRRP